MRRVDYDEHLHTVYAKGREMPAASVATWMAAFSRRLPARRPLSWLDLGCGIGRLTPALAEAFGGPVTGVEPSPQMLAQARSRAAHHRVVRPGGRLLIRTNFSDRMPDLWWFRWFPAARIVDRGMYQALDAVVADFTAAGWSRAALDEVETVEAPSRREHFERLRTRALSIFEHLPEEEIERGFTAIEAALGPMDDQPVVSRGDLLVFQR
jgi:hypothetical protein